MAWYVILHVQGHYHGIQNKLKHIKLKIKKNLPIIGICFWHFLSIAGAAKQI